MLPDTNALHYYSVKSRPLFSASALTDRRSRQVLLKCILTWIHSAAHFGLITTTVPEHIWNTYVMWMFIILRWHLCKIDNIIRRGTFNYFLCQSSWITVFNFYRHPPVWSDRRRVRSFKIGACWAFFLYLILYTENMWKNGNFLQKNICFSAVISSMLRDYIQ